MMQRTFTLASLAILLFLSSCETTEKIDDFPLRPKKLVVNCYFAEDSIWNFQVSHSLSVLDNAELKPVENASILLYKGDQLLDTIRMNEDDNWYRYADNLPEQGVTYSIEVTSPDYVSVLYAEDFVPNTVPVSDVQVTVLDSSFTYERYYEWGTMMRGRVEGIFEISIQDPLQVENYYELSIYTYEVDYDYYDSSIVYIYKRNVYVTLEDASLKEFLSSGNELLFGDQFFDGQEYGVKVNFQEWDVSQGQKYFVELTSYNRTGYLYKKSISDYEAANGDPFSEPVRIFCNIENGYGIFTGYSKYTHVFSMN